jgi:hypothetical protein
MSAEPWVGALGADGATVVARLPADCAAVRLRANDGSADTLSSPVATSNRVAKIPISGLSADTEYTYTVVADGVDTAGVGRFRTAPAPGAANFTVAFSGDTNTGSNAVVFDTIRAAAPLLFIHLGDMHYTNINVNTPATYRAAYDAVFAQTRQAWLYRVTPTAYVFDDHDYGPDDSHAGSTGHDAAGLVYRERVPHYPLADASTTGHVGQSWVIGRVRFVMTDQRSAASNKTATDNSSKTMLGSSQKAWFKSELDAAVVAGQAVVWICPRAFGGPASAGADHWGGFTTERTELANYIKANAHGRVVVISADRHALDIDDGTNHDFATGGGEPLPCFQAAPLDQTPNTSYGGGTYSEGTFGNNGQYGTMAVADSGGSTIGITWRGFNSSGTQIVSYSFSVSV